MSLLISNGFLMTACGGAKPPAKPVAQDHEPPIQVDEPGTEPPSEEEPDWNKKGGPGAGGGYPPSDVVVLSDAARRKA